VNTRPFDPLADLTLSPVHKAAARKHLDQLAAQTQQPELRDLAREVLSGRVNLRGALHDPRVAALLDEQVGRFSAWYRELPAEERAEQERLAEQFAEQARRDSAAPSPREIRRLRPDDEGDWAEPRPILRKRRR
jgi:hypothetical protein